MKVIEGKVIHGAQLGRKMGFPTANIDAQKIENIENGVYFSYVDIEDQQYRAMSNIGFRPSVDGRTRFLETHIFDFGGDLYDKIIKVTLIRKIRDEQRFSSIDELQSQLKADAAICRTSE